MGILNSASKAFASAEEACTASYPACRCAAQPTRTDTGESTTDESRIVVRCIEGLCTTALQ
jgi:hypothetical protein